MKVSNRHRARELAVQGIYSWQLSNNAIEQIELSLATSNDMKKVDMPFFQRLLRGTVEDVVLLDEKIKPYLGRLPEELDPIEKAILRLATFELIACVDVPFRVVINEYVELAKTFGAQESHKFINGALDKAVKTLRENER
ncbi:transcription antitermination factor NusB [Alteromonas sediminis]|uniref:Transcription antitermination protein NusB n=1 Tax=Alteromonas sediminis TaxID=2259342 RepID=A0A3N5Y5Q1_9ALTE|nr:transcription antitermination factor NusB [Alteromonas sediminis]RPJ65579.1 transcription antitermination factor NusB [Alteromonas sediminis]